MPSVLRGIGGIAEFMLEVFAGISIVLLIWFFWIAVPASFYVMLMDIGMVPETLGWLISGFGAIALFGGVATVCTMKNV